MPAVTGGPRRSGCRADERGQLGGAEVLPFGFLVLVTGALLVANVWAVIDAKVATTSAAREAVRAYAEAPTEREALELGEAAARDALDGHHRDVPGAVRIIAPPPGSFVRCARVAWVVEYDVPTLSLPFVGRVGGSVITARSRHAELLDAYRSGLPVDADQGVRCGS